MIDTRSFKALLDTAFSCQVYADFVPEAAAIPAVSFIHIGQASSRVLSGEKSGRENQWRLSLHAQDLASLETLLSDAEALDNTSTARYQRVFVRYSALDSYAADDIVRRAFIDVSTYED